MSTRGGELDLARIAHDLRGPLMPLRTAAWLLRNELGDSPRACELAEIVERQSSRLARMMDELSDWGRCDDARLCADPRPLDPLFALDMVVGAIRGCASEPRCREDARGLQVNADQHRLGQLLHTLIEHAMHRAGGQSPRIDVSAEGADLCIRVHDTGPPLSPDALAALFERPQPHAFDDGLGLRMLLARCIAQAHGGTLAAEPCDDGLLVACRLPAHPADAVPG